MGVMIFTTKKRKQRKKKNEKNVQINRYLNEYDDECRNNNMIIKTLTIGFVSNKVKKFFVCFFCVFFLKVIHLQC